MAKIASSNAVKQYGNYKFFLTDQHLQADQLESLRHRYDEFGMSVLERLQIIAQNNNDSGRKLDLLEVLKNHHENDPLLDKFWAQVQEPPGWIDWDQIERGQRVFARYAVPMMIGLALQGFVVENTASPGNVEVLVRTGGFSKRVVLPRLVETFQWVIQITDCLESIRPGGDGHNSTIRVHLLHSSVRQRLQKLAEKRTEYYNTSENGPPINLLDSIHAISNLSANAMWLQLPTMGITPTSQEVADWVALFRYIAYLLATPDQFFENSFQAKLTMESIIANEWRMSENSAVILNNFIHVLVDLPWFNFSRDFIVAGSRIINGQKMCNELGLEDANAVSYAAFRGLIWLCKTFVFFQRKFSPFDDFMICYWRDLLHSKVVRTAMQGGGTFKFKHVPELGYLTKADTDRRDVSWIWHRRVEATGLAVFALVWFLLLCLGWIIISFACRLLDGM